MLSVFPVNSFPIFNGIIEELTCGLLHSFLFFESFCERNLITVVENRWYFTNSLNDCTRENNNDDSFHLIILIYNQDSRWSLIDNLKYLVFNKRYVASTSGTRKHFVTILVIGNFIFSLSIVTQWKVHFWFISFICDVNISSTSTSKTRAITISSINQHISSDRNKLFL